MVHADTSRVSRTQIRPVQSFKSDLLIVCDVGPNEMPLFDKLSVNLAKSALIELHDGTFELESTLGMGTMVRITFPLERLVQRDGASRVADVDLALAS